MGRSVPEEKRAVTLAIIKQSDENMDVMKEKLKETPIILLLYIRILNSA